MDDHQKAIVLFQAAVECVKCQDISKANNLLNEAALADEQFVSHPAYNYLNAKINAMAGRLGAAEEFFLRTIQIDRKYGNAMQELGELYLRTGRLKEAGHHLIRHQALSFWKGREDVFVFGDSHAQSLFGGIARCKVQWLGAVTMHRVGRDGLAFLDFKARGVRDGATVVSVFGEIDVRAHALRQRDEKGRSLDEVVATLVARYVGCLVENRSRYGVGLAVCSITPPTNAISKAHHALYGSLDDRRLATECLNEGLRQACGEQNIAYLDIHRYLADWNGYLNRAYADSNVHAHPGLCDLVEYEMNSVLGLA